MFANENRLETGTRLVVSRSSRKLHYYVGDRIIKTYPVAVGKHSTPTPLGNYQVVNKIVNPGGALGTRWLGLNIPGGNYGIHGNNNPSSIGKYISNGCIRMYNHDIEELFPKINIGTPVIITGDPDSIPVQGNPGGRHQYIVKPGDTLWKICRQFNVRIDTVISINGLSNPDQLTPGQTIIIP